MRCVTLLQRNAKSVPQALGFCKQDIERGVKRVTETYYTIRQVAERHNVAYQTIWSMVKSGELEAVRIKTAWRIPESALAKLTIKTPVEP